MSSQVVTPLNVDKNDERDVDIESDVSLQHNFFYSYSDSGLFTVV